MRAIRLHEFGAAEKLRNESVADPEPGPGQVRIAVAAAGVHLLDTSLRQGIVSGPMPLPELPTVPGREVAGTVDRVGPGVEPSWLGRRAVAHIGQVPGGYAELTVTAAERLHEIPEGLDAGVAVAMIGTGRTALGILGFVEAGPETVAIVPSAAGGIGTLLVQYLVGAGATVIGLAGGKAKADQVFENGADLALDYLDAAWPEAVRAKYGQQPATVLFDGVGGEIARAGVDLLGQGGVRLVFGWSAGRIEMDETALADRGVTTQFVLGPPMLERAGGLRALETRALAEAAAGRLRPAVQRFPLAEAVAAHRALEQRQTTGKVVLVP
ncbi:zinc-binding dehydrogenase [Nocardia seriolae]|uniref:zinc-binding dehydrogenase n=1 Tax=Nocardia seriolae TaxID=37332 RepID=UPI00051A6AAC|nr:zinc-binding dehydrogenase [Nocardia seriolae]MTJ63337.1 zinc-binding dehydrogenase [Nocardia seriolae]MTJ71214.1 zinc-binding dehydrogenase [Nocardia seriolae]MTJ88861.1 zinc-binding dehydrogenase [Nocardia seriolae]MTK32843.1 zinc-binding dehydrogenase [Nocardia seriolae]MTK41233.1 zinc-binding dehydrogenase [Nocardia seriolae]